jgi:hypothetical protein
MPCGEGSRISRALQDRLQASGAHCTLQSQILAPTDVAPSQFRPTPPLPFRTHVPRADDTSTEQALAPRAGARCRGNGTRVRDAGRGNARRIASRRPGSPAGSDARIGSPAGSGWVCRVGRPHDRSPAPTTAHTSATRAPQRHRPPARPGLPHAGTSPGTTAGLTAGRRPVWEDGSAGRPGVLPGAPDFNALGPPANWAARVLHSW